MYGGRMTQLPHNNLFVVSDSYEPIENQSSSGREQNQKKRHFSDEAIKNITNLAEIFKKIHLRLISEGYTIKEGKIIPPKKE